MLEQKIDLLTETVKELTAVIKAGGLSTGAKATTGAATATPAKAAEKAKPTITPEEMKTTAFAFRDKFTPAVTTALIKELTGAGKLSEVKPEDFGKLHAAMKEKLDAPEPEAASEDI